MLYKIPFFPFEIPPVKMHFNLANVALLASALVAVTIEASGKNLVPTVAALGVCGYAVYELCGSVDRKSANRDPRYNKDKSPNIRLYPKLAKECREYPLGTADLTHFRVNCPFPDGESPLIKAVKQGDLDAVLKLIHERADLRATDVNGRTALHHAASRGDLLMFEVLMSNGAKLYARDKFNTCPIAFGAAMGKQGFAQDALALYGPRLSAEQVKRIEEILGANHGGA